jgi:hypothetical protein
LSRDSAWLGVGTEVFGGGGGEDCKTGRESWDCVEMGDVKVMNNKNATILITGADGWFSS